MFTGKLLTIGDIQTRDILYYDKTLNDICYKFCEKREIDCLPAIDDPKFVYIRKSRYKFEQEHVERDRIVRGTVNIFHPIMVERFHKQPLLLVYDNNELTGVVHFSDYNLPIVSHYLFEKLFAYEKAIRIFLSIEERKTLKSYENKGLLDVIKQTNRKGKLKLDEDVKNLRNSVMHAKEFVNKQSQTSDDMVYDYVSFELFYKRVLNLHRDYKLISNYVAFTQNNP